MRGSNVLTICHAEMCRAMTIYLKSLSPHDVAETSRVVAVKKVKAGFEISLEQTMTGKVSRDPEYDEAKTTKANL